MRKNNVFMLLEVGDYILCCIWMEMRWFYVTSWPPHHSLGGSPFASILQVASHCCDICREQQEQGSIWISVPAKWTFTSPAEVQSTSPLLQSSGRTTAPDREESMLLTLPLCSSLHKAARLAPPPWTWWSWRLRTVVFSRSLLLSRPTLSFPPRPYSSFFTFFDWSCQSLKIRWDINAFLSSVESRWGCGWLPRSIALYRFVHFITFIYFCVHIYQRGAFWYIYKKKKSCRTFFPLVSMETRVLQRFFLEG